MIYNNYKFLFTEIDFLKKKNIFKIYLIYIFFVIICSIIFSFLFIDRFPWIIEKNSYNIIIEKIPFNFGNLIHNLVYKNIYIQKIYDTNFYVARHPFLPIFLTILFKISKNFFFIVISKNIILFTTYFFFSYIFLLKNRNTVTLFLTVLLVPIVVPYNFSVALNFVYEDNLLAIFLPLLFLGLLGNNNYKFLYVGVILFVLYFIKSSVFFIVLILPLIIIFFNKRFIYFPLIMSVLAVIIWGGFGYYKSGRFPFLGSLESINSHNLSSALNKNFHRYYPNLNVDLLLKEPSKKINSEWEFYDYYNIENKKFLKDNFTQYISDITIKLKFIFFGIRIDGLVDNQSGESINNQDLSYKRFSSFGRPIYLNKYHENPIRYSSIFSKLFFNIAIIIATFNLFKKHKKFYKLKLEVYFLSIVILYLIPFIVGWATSKHLVPISNISLLYLILHFYSKFNLSKIINSYKKKL
jgi:hypothetical protein